MTTLTKKLGIALLVCAFLTAWCGIWWSQDADTMIRYLMQFALFFFCGLVLSTMPEGGP